MNDIDSILSFDALAHAESVTGKSYKDDKATAALGFASHIAHVERVRDEMSLRDDTHYGISYMDAVRIVEDLGFTLVHEHDFHPKPYRGETQRTENFRVYWRADGVLLDMNSHCGNANRLKISYNWVPNDWDTRFAFTSSGSVHTPYDLRDPRGDDQSCWTWIGDHDARTGLRHILGRMTAAGRFLPAWVEQPFLWLLDYAQEKGDYDRDAINAAVIDSFPAEVRAAILAGK